jgi:hypothetical protein
MEVFVYKTNIIETPDVMKVSAVFSGQKAIHTWNVDTEDIDKILRIEAQNSISAQIVEMVQNAGYWCEELI